MTDWRPIPQKRQEVGDAVVDYLRNPDRHGEGGHEITFSDGRRLRVLPDDRTTAKQRKYAILVGLTHAEDVQGEHNPDPDDEFDALAYVVGLLVVRGADCWEVADTRLTPETIIRDVISDGWTGPDAARKAIRELEEAGYVIQAEDA